MHSRFVNLALQLLLLAGTQQILGGLISDDLRCADNASPAMPAEEDVESSGESEIEKARSFGDAVTASHDDGLNSLWQVLSVDAARDAAIALGAVEVPRGPPAV